MGNQTARRQDPAIRRVLLAVADPWLRQETDQMLVASGFEVVLAHDGLEALNYITAAELAPQAVGPPDVVVLDQRLQGADGLDLIAGLRRIDRHRPVVLLTEASTRPRGSSAKAMETTLLDLSVDAQELTRCVQQLVPGP